MSDQSYESESIFSEETSVASVAPVNQLIEKLKTELRNELESYKRKMSKMSKKVQFLQVKFSDAEIEIAGLKTKNKDLEKRVTELENTAETHKHNIDHLEKTLDEKILETEMKKVTIEKKEMSRPVSNWPSEGPSNFTIRNPSSRNLRSASEMVATKNFGLNDDELETLYQYGCLGHFLDNDKWGGKKWIDENGFALLLKAIDHGLRNFTFKLFRSTELNVGTSKLDYSAESEKQEDEDCKNVYKFALTYNGRKMQFRARCHVMNLHGFERISFPFNETDSNGVYEQVFMNSEIPGRGRVFCRFHVCLIY